MKHRGVKIITEDAEKDVTFLMDADPLFVSLVKHGANQQPFRVIKQDDVPAPVQSTLPKTVGFIDTNLGIDHALACVDTFKTYLFIDSGGGFPAIHDHCSGDGFVGLNKVKDMGGVLDKDFVVITDCYYGELADRRRKRNKLTFGPSGEWTKIENDRVYGWKRLKEMGVGVPDGQIVHGMDQFLSYVQRNQGNGSVFFIKVSEYRGNRETGGAVRNTTEALTAITQAGFGPYLTDLEILVQLQCPGIEVGFDAFFNGKDFLRPYLYTIEEKGSGTVGVWTDGNGIDELILNRIKPSLQETDYRGNVSFEFFWDGKQVYCHDPTARMPFPCSSIQAHFVRNEPEVLYRCAAGEDCPVQVGKKYVAQVGVYTEEELTWRPILFPDELRPNIGFRRVVIRDDEFYFVPGDSVVATAVGEGDTAQEAMQNAMDVVMQIECSNTYVPADFVENTGKKIDKLNALGDDFKF